MRYYLGYSLRGLAIVASLVVDLFKQHVETVHSLSEAQGLLL